MSTTMQERRRNRPKSIKWQAELLEVIDESPDVRTFRFRKPEGWTFIPGQYVMVFFPEVFGKKNRAYSIASSPNNEYLELTIKLYGIFTHHMWTQKPGDVCTLRGPYGHYVLKTKSDRDVLLISAGVGVTPNMSMMRWATEEKLERRFLHLYSNKKTRDMVFDDEIDEICSDNKHIKNIHTLTRYQENVDEVWNGRLGRISESMIREELSEWLDSGRELPEVYSCGPEVMNMMVKELLISMGWDEKDIHYEKFW